jgi:hypothetical protein
MDLLITAAARALAASDPLGALKRVALRNDAPGREALYCLAFNNVCPLQLSGGAKRTWSHRALFFDSRADVLAASHGFEP